MTHDYHSSIATPPQKKKRWTPRKYVERNPGISWTLFYFFEACYNMPAGDVNLSQDLKLTQGAGAVGEHEAN